MKIISLNTGLPRDVVWHGRTVTTSIYKNPVDGRISLRRLNLDGDRQADLTVHGGAFKAVYCYAIEHYAWWTKELRGQELPRGMFGENFTTDGLDEDSVHLGDQFVIGTAHSLSHSLACPATNSASDFRPMTWSNGFSQAAGRVSTWQFNERARSRPGIPSPWSVKIAVVCALQTSRVCMSRRPSLEMISQR